MLADSNLVAFVPSADLPRARAFYEVTLGLPVKTADNFAVAVDAHGTTVRITEVGPFTAQPFTVLGWVVADIAATVRALVARSVEFRRYEGLEQDADGVWDVPGGGARVAWFRDPDGNTLSLTEVLAG